MPTWARVAVCATILIIVFERVDSARLRDTLRGVDLWMTLIPVGLIGLFLLASACRWFVLLRCVEPRVRLADVVRIHVVSGFLGMFAPGTVGMELARIAGAPSANVTPMRAVLSTILERLLGAIGLSLVVAAGMVIAPQYVEPPVAVAAAVVFLGTAGFLTVVASKAMRQLALPLIPKPVAQLAAGWLTRVGESVDAYRGQRDAIALALLLSLVTYSLRIAVVVGAAAALSINVPVSLLIVAVPVVSLALMLPITIGGLGVREAGYAYFFEQAGYTAADGVAMSLLLLAVYTVSALPGGVLFLIARRSRGS